MAAYDIYGTAPITQTTSNAPSPISLSVAYAGSCGFTPPEPEEEPDSLIPTPAAITTVPPESYDYELTSSKRWDQLSMELFGTYDRILDLMDANPHITLEEKKALYLPVGTRINKPQESGEIEAGAIGAKSWRA